MKTSVIDDFEEIYKNMRRIKQQESSEELPSDTGVNITNKDDPQQQQPQPLYGTHYRSIGEIYREFLENPITKIKISTEYMGN